MKLSKDMELTEEAIVFTLTFLFKELERRKISYSEQYLTQVAALLVELRDRYSSRDGEHIPCLKSTIRRKVRIIVNKVQATFSESTRKKKALKHPSLL